jgi:hypothetical protein
LTLTDSDKAKVLNDLAELVSADRRTARPIWTREVLEALLPSLCCEDLTPAVCVDLFTELVDEREILGSASASLREMNIADANAEHYVASLVHGAARQVAS